MYIQCQKVKNINFENLNIIAFVFIFISSLYSSVGHGGASGYLAVLSLFAIGQNDIFWLKSNVLVLNILVSSIALYRFSRKGYLNFNFSYPFVLGSVPFAYIGSIIDIHHHIYEILLSITLFWMSIKLLFSLKNKETKINPSNFYLRFSIGSFIGFFSGLIGIGGGVFLSPILFFLSWETTKKITGASTLFVFSNSISGVIGLNSSSNFLLNQNTILFFACAVIIGTIIGTQFSLSFGSRKNIKIILSFVVFLAAIKRFLI